MGCGNSGSPVRMTHVMEKAAKLLLETNNDRAKKKSVRGNMIFREFNLDSHRQAVTLNQMARMANVANVANFCKTKTHFR